MPDLPPAPDPLLPARARVPRDLDAATMDTGPVVSLLDAALPHPPTPK